MATVREMSPNWSIVHFILYVIGVRMLDGVVTDLLEAEAVTYNNQYIDIYSASWGPTDDGKTMEGPHRYCERALQEGVTKACMFSFFEDL